MAIAIPAQISAGRQKLRGQVTAGAMEFDPIKARCDRVARCRSELLDHARNFRKQQFARLIEISHARSGDYLAARPDW